MQSVAQFQATVAQRHPAAIWINETALDQVPRDWLHTQFQQSVVIVGIDTTLRELATAVGADPTWDWSSEWRPPSTPTFVVVYRADFSSINSEGRPSKSYRRGGFNDLYDPQNPGKLFNLVRLAIRQAQQPNDGPVPTPLPPR